MEHRLWQYTSQKNTDCELISFILPILLSIYSHSILGNLIARQLNVPTPYLIRHAAFLYETQLRGIQQQLRMGEMGKAKSAESASASGRSSRASRPSSALHGKHILVSHSVRYSTWAYPSPLLQHIPILETDRCQQQAWHPQPVAQEEQIIPQVIHVFHYEV